jgi:glyoxylase-like metal-dependent hydrolase (beta-lactamase superfamily II)
MKIIPLSEGAFTVDRSKKFVPFDTMTDDLQQRALGSLLVEVQPFVIVTARDILLLDTGMGYEKNGVLQLHANLRHAGIPPTSITKVLMSHLHKDHAGGAVQFNPASNSYGLSLPEARYYIQQNELAYALDKGLPSYIPDELACLKKAVNVVLLEGDGLLDKYIRYEVTGAHCPYHQVFWIEENGEKIFFGGDVAPQIQQMKNRFIAKYDFDGKKCMELRKQWWHQGQIEKWTFLFYHDIKTPVFTNQPDQ